MTNTLWERFISKLDFLVESESSDLAHKLGLKYAGRGYWKDDQGTTVAKTQDGKLIKLDGGEYEAPAEEPSIQEPSPPTQPELPDDHFHKLAGAMYSQVPKKPVENTFDEEDATTAIFGYTTFGQMSWEPKQIKFFKKQLSRIKNAKTNVDIYNAGTALKKAGLLDKEGWKKLLKYVKETRTDLEKYVAPSKKGELTPNEKAFQNMTATSSQESPSAKSLEHIFEPVIDSTYNAAANILHNQKGNLVEPFLDMYDKYTNATQEKVKAYDAGVMNALAAKGANLILSIEGGNVENALKTVQGSLDNAARTQAQKYWFALIKKHLEASVEPTPAPEIDPEKPNTTYIAVSPAAKLVHSFVGIGPVGRSKILKAINTVLDGGMSSGVATNLIDKVLDDYKLTPGERKGVLDDVSNFIHDTFKDPQGYAKTLISQKGFDDAHAYAIGRLHTVLQDSPAYKYWQSVVHTLESPPTATSEPKTSVTPVIPPSAVKAANTLMAKIHNLDAAKAWAQKKANAATGPKEKEQFLHIISALDAYHSGTPVEEPQATPEPTKEPEPVVSAPQPELTKTQQTAQKIINKFGSHKIGKAIAWANKMKADAKFSKKKAQWDEVIAHLEKVQAGLPLTAPETPAQVLSPPVVPVQPPSVTPEPTKPKTLSFVDIANKYAQPSSPKIFDTYFNKAMNAKTLAELDQALSVLKGVGTLDDKKIAEMRKDLLTLRADLLPPDTTKMDLQKEMEANVVHAFFQKFPMANKTPEEKKAITDMLIQACNQPSYQDMKKVLLSMKDKGMIGDNEINAMKDFNTGIPGFFNQKEAKHQKIEWEKANAEKIAAEKAAMEKKLAALTPEKKKQFNDIFTDLEQSGAIKTLPQSSQTTIKNSIIGSMVANDVDDVMDKLKPLTGAGLGAKDIMAIRGKVLNAFLDIPPYQPKSEPPTTTPPQTRTAQILNKWVDTAGFGIANIPSGEQEALKNAITMALTTTPNKVDDAITSLNFNTSILTPQIEMIRDFVKQERQQPGVFKDVGKINPAAEPVLKKLPTANAPFGLTPKGKPKKAPKASDRIGKKMASLGIAPEKFDEIRPLVAAVIKKYANEPYYQGAANAVVNALQSVTGMPYGARRKLALFARGEIKKGLAGAYNDKGLMDKAAAIKAAQQSLASSSSPPSALAGIPDAHFLANTTLVAGEKIDFNPKAKAANFYKQTVPAHVTQADKKAAIEQANEFKKNLPPKIYEKFQHAVHVIKSSSWFNKSSIERKATNEALTKVANGPPPAVTTVSNWVERGMHIPNKDIKDFMKAFKIGETAYLGPSEFSLDGGISNGFAGNGQSSGESTSILMRVRPPHTGKLNAIHVHQGEHSSHSGEYGVFLGMNKNLLVTEVIKHVFNHGKSIAYEIIMMQDDPALLEAHLKEPQTNSFGLISQYWDEMGIGSRTRAILIKYMNGPMGDPNNKFSQPSQQMDKASLNKLIRSELKKLMSESTINMDPYSYDADHAFSNTNDALSPGSKLMQTPGAPYGGNLSAYSQVPMNNESRLALKDWLRFAKAAWAKFGAPSNWPEKYTQIAVKLGQKFEEFNRPQQTSIGYRP